MVFRSALALLMGMVLSTAACSMAESDANAGSGDDNPFFTESTLPLGMPEFDRIEDGHFAPAFARGMAEQRAEIDRIAEQSEPPTLENTPIAMERSGQLLQRVRSTFSSRRSADPNDEG